MNSQTLMNCVPGVLDQRLLQVGNGLMLVGIEGIDSPRIGTSFRTSLGRDGGVVWDIEGFVMPMYNTREMEVVFRDAYTWEQAGMSSS